MASPLSVGFQESARHRHSPWAVAAFLTFEYVITFDREVELFWKKGVTGASVLFLSNRYTSLLSAVIQNAATNLESEKASQSARQYQRSQSDSFSRRGRASSLIYVHSTVIQNVPCLRCIEVNNATIAIVVLPYITWAGRSTSHSRQKNSSRRSRCSIFRAADICALPTSAQGTARIVGSFIVFGAYSHQLGK